MTTPQEFNEPVITEFRANGGAVRTAHGGVFAEMPLVILGTTGARTGQPRHNPVAAVREGDRLVTMASNEGADTHPDWYHNLLATPTATVDTGIETRQVTASVVESDVDPDEYQRLYDLLVAHVPVYATYPEKTNRNIPIVVLSPA